MLSIGVGDTWQCEELLLFIKLSWRVAVDDGMHLQLQCWGVGRGVDDTGKRRESSSSTQDANGPRTSHWALDE